MIPSDLTEHLARDLYRSRHRLVELSPELWRSVPAQDRVTYRQIAYQALYTVYSDQLLLHEETTNGHSRP